MNKATCYQKSCLDQTKVVHQNEITRIIIHVYKVVYTVIVNGGLSIIVAICLSEMAFLFLIHCSVTPAT